MIKRARATQHPVARAREKTGMTQYRLAKLAGISQASLAKIENGYVKTPGVGVALAISDALGVDVRKLFEKRTAA